MEDREMNRPESTADVTAEFLELSDQDFREAIERSAHSGVRIFRINLDLTEVVGDNAKLNSLKHFMMERTAEGSDQRSLIVRATQEEADHFRASFPPGAEWQIITRD
jgi:hypothetical protein